METPKTFFLTIPNGQTESEVFNMGENGFRSPVTMLMLAPDDLPETVNVLVCGPSGRFCKLRSGMTVITLAAGCADQATVMNVSKIKLKATAGVAGDRIVEMLYNHTVENRV